MKLPVTLQKKIIDFLISLPNIHGSDSQWAFTYKAGLDQELQDQIPFGKPPVEFIPLFVSKLLKYGKINDGREALEAILETTKDFIGYDRREYCETLLKELHANLSNTHVEGVDNKVFQHTKLLLILSLFIVLSVAVTFGIIVPLWEKNSVLSAERESIRHMQARLIEYGYDAGAIDWQWGKKTEWAIQQYHQKNSGFVNIIKDEVSEPNSQFEKFLNNEQFQKLIEN